jgi:hypothetical protein
MKIIFRTETEILREVESSQIDDKTQFELEKEFDDRQILKYEMVFESDILVKQCHDFNNISENMVKTLIVTIS